MPCDQLEVRRRESEKISEAQEEEVAALHFRGKGEGEGKPSWPLVVNGAVLSWEEKGVTDLVHGGWCSIAEVRFSRRRLVLFILEQEWLDH